MDYMDDELTAMIRKYLKDKNFASEYIKKNTGANNYE